MTFDQVYQIISGVEIAPGEPIPCAYYMFPEDDPNNPAPPPPFTCYYYQADNDFKADDTNYQAIRQLIIELYCDNKDFTLEKAVEDVLSSNGFVYTKSEDYISSEKLYMTTYETEVIITNG